LPGSGSSIIKSELKEINLNRAPAFEALSYVWGCSDSPQDIECNGHLKSVTPNLCVALRRLRLVDKEQVVWIDAICINQENLDERSRQVLLMQEIYTRALRVIIWLGEDEGYAAVAIKVI
jgi:hypothetical protein